MFAWKILGGLSAEGEPPVPFSATGRGTHREGLVVEFLSEGGERWVGNFQPGTGEFTGVFAFPGGGVLVVAWGEGYVVDPDTRVLRELVGGGFLEGAMEMADARQLVLHDGVHLTLLGADGIQWTSRRVSWDGIWGLRVENGVMQGVSWDAINEIDVPFQVDLATGAARGGGYQL